MFGEGLGVWLVGWKKISKARKDQMAWVAYGYGCGDDVVGSLWASVTDIESLTSRAGRNGGPVCVVDTCCLVDSIF